jgi:peptide/nickel transport system ATP-binding protein/oligopeptide transport system ATP-binding protein
MTLRAILGLLPHGARITAGDVMLEGENLASASPERLREIRGRRIAMIFQEPSAALDPVMRVGPQIAEGPATQLGLDRAAAQARAVELMALTGIPAAGTRSRAYPHELSGGMRQRVMIASALASEPAILLCDEPTTALDVTIQDQVLRLLAELRGRRGLSLVYVTHDLAVVAQTCERLAVMYAGRLVETGFVDHVFRRPLHPYTLGFCAPSSTSTLHVRSWRRYPARRRTRFTSRAAAPSTPLPPCAGRLCDRAGRAGRGHARSLDRLHSPPPAPPRALASAGCLKGPRPSRSSRSGACGRTSS